MRWRPRPARAAAVRRARRSRRLRSLAAGPRGLRPRPDPGARHRGAGGAARGSRPTARSTSRVNEWMLAWLAPSVIRRRTRPASARRSTRWTGWWARTSLSARTPAEARGARPARRDAPRASAPRSSRCSGRPPGAARGTPGGDAVAYYAARSPRSWPRQVQQEVRRRDEAMAAMERAACAAVAAGARVGLAAPLVLAGLYLGLLRPLFGRLAAGDCGGRRARRRALRRRPRAGTTSSGCCWPGCGGRRHASRATGRG